VIGSALTATANAVTFSGATPVFVDVDPVTWHPAPTKIKAAVTPQKKGIISVHLLGHPAEMVLRPRVVILFGTMLALLETGNPGKLRGVARWAAGGYRSRHGWTDEARDPRSGCAGPEVPAEDPSAAVAAAERDQCQICGNLN
jgi:hypothetical protein